MSPVLAFATDEVSTTLYTTDVKLTTEQRLVAPRSNTVHIRAGPVPDPYVNEARQELETKQKRH